MSHKTHQYTNASIADLFEWSSQNPNRCHTLSPIEMKVETYEETQNSLASNLCLPHHTATSLEPSGPLSACAWMTDTLYGLTHIHGRPKMVRELATHLQLATENLKGSSISRKRTKIHDIIGTLSNGSQVKDDELELFWEGVSHMKQVQIILIKSTNIFEASSSEHKGECIFSTSPHTWKNNVPIWVVDFYGNWIATSSASRNTIPFSRTFSKWIQEIETTGWIIQWPEYDGNKDIIIEQLIRITPDWKASDAKLKKEILSKRLGRALSLNQFNSWERIADAENFDEA